MENFRQDSNDNSDNKINDRLFQLQLCHAASEDGLARGNLTTTMESILKTSSKTGKKTLFLRHLSQLGYKGVFLSNAQKERMTCGPLEHDPGHPDGCSIFLMHVPGADHFEAEENAYV